jgi:hypothetical protein
MQSIFSLRRQQDEPYLTQVFAFLLINNRDYCEAFVKDCLGHKEIGETIEVFPESTSGQGRADILIRTNNINLAIENKIDACFTPDQLKRYQVAFDKVFLIYRHLQDPKQSKYADKSLTWYQVYSFTKNFISKNQQQDEVSKFILKHFQQYLEEINMSIEKVSSEIVEGSQSVINLSNQIIEALRRLKEQGIISKYGNKAPSSSEFYFSYSVTTKKNKDIIIYYYLKPLVVVVSFYDTKKSNFKTVSGVHADLPSWDEQFKFLSSFYPAKNNFFDKHIDQQIDYIADIIKAGVDDLTKNNVR